MLRSAVRADLSRDLGWNVLFSQRGHLTCAIPILPLPGCGCARRTKLLGVDSRMSVPRKSGLVPAIDLSSGARYPVLAALYHPPGGIIRHDAVVWGYARACDRRASISIPDGSYRH